MALPNIEIEGTYRNLQSDIMTWLYQNDNKHNKGGCNLAWHETRNAFVKFLIDKGYRKVE